MVLDFFLPEFSNLDQFLSELVSKRSGAGLGDLVALTTNFFLALEVGVGDLQGSGIGGKGKGGDSSFSRDTRDGWGGNGGVSSLLVFRNSFFWRWRGSDQFLSKGGWGFGWKDFRVLGPLFQVEKSSFPGLTSAFKVIAAFGVFPDLFFPLFVPTNRRVSGYCSNGKRSFRGARYHPLNPRHRRHQKDGLGRRYKATEIWLLLRPPPNSCSSAGQFSRRTLLLIVRGRATESVHQTTCPSSRLPVVSKTKLIIKLLLLSSENTVYLLV